MAKVTIVFGVLLIVLGGVAFALLGHHSHTMIPAGFGLVLAVCGVLAMTEDAKKRMLWMHIAVTVGLLGFLGTIPGMIGVIKLMAGQATVRPEAAKVQTVMGLLCLVFVGLCVRSFIEARRGRLAA